MKKITPNISMNYRRLLFVFASALLVLLTSCPIKSNLKTLIDIPSNSDVGLFQGSKVSSLTPSEVCAQIGDIDIHSSQKTSLDINDILPALFATITLLFLFNFGGLSRSTRHPLYTSSGKIRHSIPLFLEYRKLLIHQGSIL